MKKMSTKAQMQMNGGWYYAAECTKCGEYWSGKSKSAVKKKAVAHYFDKGGLAGKHHYRWL